MEDTQDKKKLLVSLGWDENKIYDVGGYWYYSGKNNIKVKVKRNKKGYIWLLESDISQYWFYYINRRIKWKIKKVQ